MQFSLTERLFSTRHKEREIRQEDKEKSQKNKTRKKVKRIRPGNDMSFLFEREREGKRIEESSYGAFKRQGD